MRCIKENHLEVALDNLDCFADVFCLIMYIVKKVYDKYWLSVKKSRNGDRPEVKEININRFF